MKPFEILYSKVSFTLVGLTAIFLLFGCCCFAGDSHGSFPTNQPGETLIPLKNGETAIVSYGLYCIASNSRAFSNAPVGGNLVLLLRNIGAKSINMNDVTVEDFRLQDSMGKDIKLYLRVTPQTIGYGDVTVIYITVEHYDNAAQPWTLTFKSKPKAFVPINLTITGIEPRNAIRMSVSGNVERPDPPLTNQAHKATHVSEAISSDGKVVPTDARQNPGATNNF